MGTIISSNKKEKKEKKKKSSVKVEPKNNEKADKEVENLTPNFILVSSNENSEQLPIKKRYRYEVTDLKDILNGNTYLVKSPSKKKLSPETNRKKSKSCLKLNDLDDGEKNGTVTRSRSMSPRKTTNSVTFKNTPRKKSKEKKVENKESKERKDSKESKDTNETKESKEIKDSKDTKESKTITEQIKHILDTPKKESKTVVTVGKYEQEKNNKNNLVKSENIAKDFKNNNLKPLETNKKKSNHDSLIENPDTNPMNPISDKDLNILETIRYYLDSVKQNNYNDSRPQAITESPSKTPATLRIQSTRSSKLRAKSAKRRLELQQQYEELHIGPFY